MKRWLEDRPLGSEIFRGRSPHPNSDLGLGRNIGLWRHKNNLHSTKIAFDCFLTYILDLYALESSNNENLHISKPNCFFYKRCLKVFPPPSSSSDSKFKSPRGNPKKFLSWWELPCPSKVYWEATPFFEKKSLFLLLGAHIYDAFAAGKKHPTSHNFPFWLLLDGNCLMKYVFGRFT